MADKPDDKPPRQPMSPAKRKRLQQMFEHGSRSAAKGDFKYATEMFTQCVLEDPGNLTYVASFIGNLQKQYNNNKKGSKMASLQGMHIKGSIKKASMQKDWNAVIASGLEMLKLNPWDAGALSAMANACQQLEFDDCQLAYLRAALSVDINDLELNRLAGRALARMGKYDEAILAWNRVQKVKHDDEEARKAIGDLAVEKTITKGGYEDAESSKQARADKAGGTGPGLRLTPEQNLEKQIAKDPANVSLYLQLAELYASKEGFQQAEETLQKALSISGGEVNVRERLEDMQLRRQKLQLDIARKKRNEQKSPEAVELYNKMKAELNNVEIQVYRSRCERYPANLSLKYELGLRLQRAKMFKEAIQSLQAARTDPQRKGLVLLAMGECFHEIKQDQLAVARFEEAIQEIADKDEDAKKWALYCAGRLLLAMKEFDRADKYLSELAGRDFGYKDVAECLDKLRKLRDKE